MGRGALWSALGVFPASIAGASACRTFGPVHALIGPGALGLTCAHSGSWFVTLFGADRRAWRRAVLLRFFGARFQSAGAILLLVLSRLSLPGFCLPFAPRRFGASAIPASNGFRRRHKPNELRPVKIPSPCAMGSR